MPWRHSPIPNAVMATIRTTKAALPVAHVPAIGTSAHDPAQTTPSSASVGIRRRPDRACAIGSWASTITTVLAKNASPIPSSLTPAKFFA